MGSPVRKFVPRAPRYVIRPSDERFLRFAHQDDRHRSYTTKLLNVSATGLAFVIDRDCAPALGDMIKVEFPVGDQRFAWFGRVVRAQEYSGVDSEWDEGFNTDFISDEVLIGIQFHELPEGHSLEIRKELETKFSQLIREQQKQKFSQSIHYLGKHFWSLLLYGVCIAFTVAILIWLAQPIGAFDKYSEGKGAEWGKRFDF